MALQPSTFGLRPIVSYIQWKPFVVTFRGIAIHEKQIRFGIKFGIQRRPGQQLEHRYRYRPRYKSPGALL